MTAPGAMVVVGITVGTTIAVTVMVAVAKKNTMNAAISRRLKLETV